MVSPMSPLSPRIVRPRKDPDPQSFPPVLPPSDYIYQFKSLNPLVRDDAVQALVQLGDTAAGHAATVILLPSRSFLEKQAARAVLLRLIKEKKSVPAVEALLRLAQRGPEALVRIEALEILAECGPLVLELQPAGLRIIKAARASTNRAVKEAAIHCLEAFGVKEEDRTKTKPLRSSPLEQQDAG